MVTTKITIGPNCKLTLADVNSLARNHFSVGLNSESHQYMERSYQFLQSIVDQRLPIYGLNTQFGDQAMHVDPHMNDIDSTAYYNSIRMRQEKIIKSLACSTGDMVAPEIIKVTMMLRAHCLSQGYSGVSHHAIETLLAYLNAGIIPIVRHQGSIGASGDLIPLASIAACLIGEDVKVMYQNKEISTLHAIELAGLKKLKPTLRDGLALINGTSFMTAIASLALYDLKRLFKQMLSAIAMSLESMLVITSAYHPLIHQLKNHPGQNAVNHLILNFWIGSELLTELDEIQMLDVTSPIAKRRSVQDYYSLRSVCQGFGPFYENLEQATIWVENEMNSVNDNPIVNAIAKKIYHGANFMGYYITDTCDILKMNIGQASTWIHALLANMLHPGKNQHLPTNLVPDPSKNNGFRSLQLLAAAIAVQNRKLAQSQQSFTLPTEGDNQDVNSLGTHAAFDLTESVENLHRLTAILFLASAQALELRGIKKASKKSQAIFERIRDVSPQLIECRVMSEEIKNVVHLLKNEII